MFVLLYWLLIKEPLIEKYFREVHGTISFISFEFGINNMEFYFPFPVSCHPTYEIWEEKEVCLFVLHLVYFQFSLWLHHYLFAMLWFPLIFYMKLITRIVLLQSLCVALISAGCSIGANSFTWQTFIEYLLYVAVFST